MSIFWIQWAKALKSGGQWSPDETTVIWAQHIWITFLRQLLGNEKSCVQIEAEDWRRLLASSTIVVLKSKMTALQRKRKGAESTIISHPPGDSRSGKEAIWATLVIMQKMALFQQQFPAPPFFVSLDPKLLKLTGNEVQRKSQKISEWSFSSEVHLH